MGTERITNAISARTNRGSKALALFLTAGYPHRGSTVELVPKFAEAGADIIEIGMPFSDPLADGLIIQESSAVALRNGVSIAGILEDVLVLRRNCSVPLVLMGYINPILRYGAEKFFDDAANSGVDGVILPELPLEESGRFARQISESGLARILLVAPTTPPERVRAVDDASTGFLYCVSTTGVTGGRGKGGGEEFISLVKKNARRNPVLVGFGISTPEDVRRVSLHANGVIVGSALISKLRSEKLENVISWIHEMKSACS